MAVTVKPITLWRREVENEPGMLAETLEPLARSGADLQVVMGYRLPGHESRAAIEVYPVRGKRAEAGAREGGLSASSIPTLLVEGDNRPGLGASISRTLADAGINLAFLVTQVFGRRYSAILGFEREADAKKGATLIKRTKVSRSK